MLIASGIVVIIVLTIMTGYFVAQEFAYVSVERGKLIRLADRGDAPATRALDVTSRLSFTLSGAQFGITVTTLLVGYLGETLLSNGLTESYADAGWLPRAAMISLFSVATLIFSTAIQMVIGELGPKNLAIAKPVPLARALSRSTLIYLMVFGPIIKLFDSASNWLLRRVGIEPVQELGHEATPEDLTRIIAESHSGGTVDDDLSALLARGLSFRNRVADEVMTPRPDVVTVGANDTLDTVLELLSTGHARFPVVGNGVDDIIGIVGQHNILQVPADQRATVTVREVADEPLLLPRTMPLPKVLDALRQEHRQLAIVVDEYGGFDGVISFEDVAEEVVGEIFDEDDVETPPHTGGPDGSWELPARLRIDEAAEITGLELPEHENYDTLSGLVLNVLQRTAVAGDSVEVEWTTRNEDGVEVLHTSQIDVVSVTRHVPETVMIHPEVSEVRA